MTHRFSQLALICALLPAMAPRVGAEAAERPALPALADLPDAPRWELQMLGVTDDATLEALRAQAGRRVVTIGVVGQGGMSLSNLRPYMPPGCSFVYRSAPSFPNCDPHTGTHDNGQIRVILGLLGALGVRARIASYQPTDDWDTVARDFAAAGERCDIVVGFQSFWGSKAAMLSEAIASRPRALYVSPYVAYDNRPTSTCMQAAAWKPWGQGLAHFVTCAPLAKRSDGSVLMPTARDEKDTEIVNFIAPSFHASGPGGTCPGGATTAGVAAYLYAAAPMRPTPTQVTDWLRRSACVDEAALTSAEPFTAEHVEKLRGCIANMMLPAPAGPRMLDAPGVISLRGAFELTVSEAGAAQ